MESKRQPNELLPEFMGINAMQCWPGADSSPRASMFANHQGQTLTIAKPGENPTQTGVDRAYGRHTFHVRVPKDCTVVRVIESYNAELRRGLAGTSQDESIASTLVVYLSSDGELGHIELPRTCLNHTHLGFNYKPKKEFFSLREGSRLAKDQILLDSPNVTDSGDYNYGIPLVTALMSVAGVAEDGVIVCEDVLPSLAYKTFENRAVEWGKDRFPLPIYGDQSTGELKFFPDLGEYVRDDGILMALRDFDEVAAVVEQSIKNIHQISSGDRLTCVTGGGQCTPDGHTRQPGRVVEIKVFYNGKKLGSNEEDRRLGKVLADGAVLDGQVSKYHQNTAQYYYNIVKVYEESMRKMGGRLKIAPPLQRLITYAYAYLDHTRKLHRKTEMDVWRVEFTVEYTHIPGLGAKVTCQHGGGSAFNMHACLRSQ